MGRTYGGDARLKEEVLALKLGLVPQRQLTILRTLSASANMTPFELIHLGGGNGRWKYRGGVRDQKTTTRPWSMIARVWSGHRANTLLAVTMAAAMPSTKSAIKYGCCRPFLSAICLNICNADSHCKIAAKRHGYQKMSKGTYAIHDGFGVGREGAVRHRSNFDKTGEEGADKGLEKKTVIGVCSVVVHRAQLQANTGQRRRGTGGHFGKFLLEHLTNRVESPESFCDVGNTIDTL